MIVVAVLLYPRRPAVLRPGPLTIFVKLGEADAQTSVNTVQMWVRPTKDAGVFDVTFAVVYHGTKEAVRMHPIAGITMLLPPGTVAKSCTHTNRTGQRCFEHPLGAASYVTDVTNATADGLNVWSANLTFTIRSAALTWNANGLTVEAQLPIVKGLSYHGSVPRAGLNGDMSVTVNYLVPDAGNYDWTGGPPPLEVSSLLGATWVQPLRTLSQPIAVSGTNGSSAGEDTVRTLAAGTFLGIAGAAFVAALQEIFAYRRERIQ
jgi:hypothetical protein